MPSDALPARNAPLILFSPISPFPPFLAPPLPTTISLVLSTELSAKQQREREPQRERERERVIERETESGSEFKPKPNRVLLGDKIGLLRIGLLEKELQKTRLEQLIPIQALHALPAYKGRYAFHRVWRLSEQVVLAYPGFPATHVHHQDHAIRRRVVAKGTHDSFLGWKISAIMGLT